jgi:hypothetical protein
MSRTFKDRPASIKFNLDDRNKPKVKKNSDNEWHWMSTPMWWIRLLMNKPKRCFEHVLEKKLVGNKDLENFDFVNTNKKPFVYYW